MEERAQVTAQYADFVEYAAGNSACFEEWARGVLSDPEMLDWIASLPRPKRQPNLVFAAARWHGVPAPAPYRVLRDAVLADDGTIRATIMARATQTNDAGRLATLTPAFAQLAARHGDRPVALLEVGTSAGLCLFPDRWGYEWQTPDGVVELGPRPRLTCRVTGRAPLPSRPPPVAWRGGVDLNPLDVTDDESMRWLETLVWPEHDDRREVLRRAIVIAAADPPELVRGDLLEELPALVERAASYAPVVVFHTAVVLYLDEDGRARFQTMMKQLVAARACHWVSNEAPDVLPAVTATGPRVEVGLLVLGVDGRAVAHTHGHGRSLHWLG